MAAKQDNSPLPGPLGIQALEIALIRELAAWRDWDLVSAESELELMQRICRKTDWQKDYLSLVEDLQGRITYTRETVRKKDTTLIAAAHTNLQRAIFKLRDLLYS